MLPELRNAYQNGRLMLLLGAGASFGSRGFDDLEMPMGNDLAKELAAMMSWTYNGEALSTVYSAINAIDSSRLHAFLKTRLTNTKPSPELLNTGVVSRGRVFSR